MPQDPVDELDPQRGQDGLTLRQLHTLWTDQKTLTYPQQCRLNAARTHSEFYGLLQKGTDEQNAGGDALPALAAPAATTPPGTPAGGSSLPFDASKLSDTDWRAWRHREGL